jgi:predicted ArsR family transcriptional regulator
VSRGLAAFHLDKLVEAYEQGAAHPVADLAALGFEPHESDGLIGLGNCPFHALAARHGSLICGIAMSFVSGMAAGTPGYEAIPAPAGGSCCVALLRVRAG